MQAHEIARRRKVTFLDVSAEVQDAAADRRYDCVRDLLLRAIIAAEGDDESCILRHGGWTKNRCGDEVAVRDGRYERIEFA
jgi:hypothetical protein